jgi:hypothetical protein
MSRSRGIVGRDFEDSGRNVVVFQYLPECPSFSEEIDLTSRKRKHQIADGNGLGGILCLGCGKERNIGFRISVDKVEDGMSSGIHTGYEIGPGHWALGGNACPERQKIPFTGELLEVRKKPFSHPDGEQMGIHTIKT